MLPLFKIRQRDADIIVTTAFLLQNLERYSGKTGYMGYPLFAFTVGTDKQRVADMLTDPVCNQWGGLNHAGWDGIDLVQ